MLELLYFCLHLLPIYRFYGQLYFAYEKTVNYNRIPGNGGIDPGASGKTGITEDRINLQISLKLRRIIEQSGG